MRPSSKKSARGFSLVEVMISMAVLAIGILGVAQMQILAAAQNGLARRTSKATAVARDFVEMAQRWTWDDPRLVGPAGCEADPLQLTEDDLGFDKVPAMALGYTASPAGAANASDQAGVQNGLKLANTAYLGRALDLMGYPAVDEQGYQLMWAVRNLDTNPDAIDNGVCDARQVVVVVRYPTGAGGSYRNVITSFFQYNGTLVVNGGIQEQI